jgi:hypothetical protein
MNTYSAVNRPADTFRGASGVNLLAAVWLVISPFVLTFSQVPNGFWNNIVCGIVIGIFAIIRMTASDKANWSWANLLLGAWLIISPWALGFRQNGADALGFNTELVWNNVITGAVVAFLAVVSLAGGHALPNSAND